MAVDLDTVKRLIEVHQRGLDDEGGGPSGNGWHGGDWKLIGNEEYWDDMAAGPGLKQLIRDMIVELETCRREHTHTNPSSPTPINS